MCVLRPASRSRISRSVPIAPPRIPASTTRKRTSPQERSGTDRLHRLTLRQDDLVDTRGGQVEQLVELAAAERSALSRRLDLDQPPVAGHDDVDVDLGGRVLLVVEIEQRLAG